ncbi:MAG: sodium:alanine symporter family protein [Candidatus Marinimicrobia bacterium]|nr:sodium:alanine symporter family protein [Candidatus Neomarinimicrobiota bacterium]
MDTLRNILESLANLVWATPSFFPFMIVLLLFTGFLMTIKTRAIQIRRFFHGWKVMMGKYDDPEDEGDISHFQAISAALSATVGIGNIAGVATAIHYGGPGAMFWMWITAVLGMSLKFGSATLSLKFRDITPEGEVAGGPMYYIKKGMGGKFTWMAILFASLLMISALGIGNTIQSFTIADQMRASFSIPTWITGLFSATFIAIVIIGGVKRIGRVASILAPFMCILYVVAGLTILALNITEIPATFALIFKSAFTHSAQVGGFAGAGFMYMLVWGIKRGLFSNEAGMGSAPVAFAATKAKEPARPGMVAMIGPFIDTITVCTITGLVIITTGVWKDKRPAKIAATAQNDITVISKGTKIQQNSVLDDSKILLNTSFKVDSGAAKNVSFVKHHSLVDNAKIIVNKKPYTGKIRINSEKVMYLENSDKQIYLKGEMMENGSPLTSWAFKEGLRLFGNWGGLIITFGVLLFGLSTSISWSYYGNRGAYFVFGQKGADIYKWIFVIINFIGAIISLELVWAFGDFAFGLMAIPNLIALIYLSGTIKNEADKYTSKKHLTYQEKLKLKQKKE